MNTCHFRKVLPPDDVEISRLSLFWWRLWDYEPLKTANDWYWNHIRPIFAPQHKELRKTIPRIWCDLPEIIDNFLFACVVYYVENEEGLKNWEYQDDGHPCKDAAPMLREVYEYIKTVRPSMEQELKMNFSLIEVLTLVGKDNSSYREELRDDSKATWKNVDAIEKEINDLDTKYLTWIIANRGLMWT